MFICMRKINFIIHFFPKILQFKESCKLIGWQHFGPLLKTQNFDRYGGELSITMLVFILDYFQEKLTWQKFLKNPKKPLPKFWQKWVFLEKRALSVFKYFNYLLLRQNSGKTNEPFLSKMLDCWRYRDISDLKILQSDWPRAFWAISQELEFSKYEIC